MTPENVPRTKAASRAITSGNRIARRGVDRYVQEVAGRTVKGISIMKTVSVLLAVAALAFSVSSAEAKGCIKGAVVGGVAGHYAGHHGVLGAAAGCLYGRHRAKEQERQQQAPEQHQSQLPVMDFGQTGM
jgi:hypothetical protein